MSAQQTFFVDRSIGDTKIRRRQSRKCEQRVIGDRRSFYCGGSPDAGGKRCIRPI